MISNKHGKFKTDKYIIYMFSYINQESVNAMSIKNKVTSSAVAIYLTLPYTSGWVWYKGPDFHFLTPPPRPFRAVSFCIFSLLGAHWLCIQNLVQFAQMAYIFIFCSANFVHEYIKPIKTKDDLIQFYTTRL